MKKVYHNFIILSSLVLFSFIVDTSNVFAQSKKIKSIVKTVEKATPIAKEGYKKNDATLLLDAIEVLLKNKHFQKISYNIVSTDKKQKYKKLLDVSELLKNAEKFIAENDEKTKKRWYKMKIKYKKNRYVSLGVGDIKTIAYCVVSKDEIIHKITCINKTAIYIKNTKHLNIAIEEIWQRNKKSSSFYYETQNDCSLKIKNDYNADIEIFIFEEEL